MKNSSEKSKENFRKCVGCGYCCLKTPCDVARRLYGSGITECPQLEWSEKNNRYVCRLMGLGGILGQGYRQELYCGEGCCCGLNSWRKDVKKRSRDATSYGRIPIPPMFQAFLKAYGAEPFIGSDLTSLIMGSFQANLKMLEYSEEDIEYIMRNVVHYITSNKSSKFEGFMP